MGILPLHIETVRFMKILVNDTGLYRNLNVNERTCNICNLNRVEDEMHFFFGCNVYADDRERFLDHCLIPVNYGDLNDTDKLTYLIKFTMQFVNVIWEKRSILLGVLTQSVLPCVETVGRIHSAAYSLNNGPGSSITLKLEARGAAFPLVSARS